MHIFVCTNNLFLLIQAFKLCAFFAALSLSTFYILFLVVFFVYFDIQDVLHFWIQAAETSFLLRVAGHSVRDRRRCRETTEVQASPRGAE